MVITFSEQYGSAGFWIAQGLAEKSGYKFCNDDIITSAMKDSGIDLKEDTFSYFDLKLDDSLTKSIDVDQLTSDHTDFQAGLRSENDLFPLSDYVNKMVSSLSLDVSPLSWDMDAAQRQVINALANEGNCVIMGKCSDYYLKDRADKISIFTYDDFPNRINRIMQRFSVDQSNAEAVIKKTDRRRDNYHRYFTGTYVGDPEYYDLIICTKLLPVEEWIDVLADIAKRHAGL